jgi:hypothetical protein
MFSVSLSEFAANATSKSCSRPLWLLTQRRHPAMALPQLRKAVRRNALNGLDACRLALSVDVIADSGPCSAGATQLHRPLAAELARDPQDVLV